MRAIWNGITIAASDDAIVVEGNHYFPLDSVDPNVLHTSRMKSLCPWKGPASYYHLEAGARTQPEWRLDIPTPWAWIRKIKNRVAFWNGVRVVPD